MRARAETLCTTEFLWFSTIEFNTNKLKRVHLLWIRIWLTGPFSISRQVMSVNLLLFFLLLLMLLLLLLFTIFVAASLAAFRFRAKCDFTRHVHLWQVFLLWLCLGGIISFTVTKILIFTLFMLERCAATNWGSLIRLIV